jgi:hypothetical protein
MDLLDPREDPPSLGASESRRAVTDKSSLMRSEPSAIPDASSTSACAHPQHIRLKRILKHIRDTGRLFPHAAAAGGLAAASARRDTRR